MRTNIVIDDKLMDAVMSTGDYKTKREAVEAGLRLIQRRKAYAAIRAARGTLHCGSCQAICRQKRSAQRGFLGIGAGSGVSGLR